MTFVMLYLVGLLLKLEARWFFHRCIGYMKAVEIAGLAGMIPALGTVVLMLLVVIKGTIFVTAGPSVFLSEIDPQNKLHLALTSLNVVTIWYIVVLSIGLATLAQVKLFKALAPLLGLWAVTRIVIIFCGLGSSGW
jgi:hypothetical protein